MLYIHIVLFTSTGVPLIVPDVTVNKSTLTTTDNTTTSYVITNLTSMTNYTFSVVATNSIGSGEAGVGMIITPGKVMDICTCRCHFACMYIHIYHEPQL